MFRRKFFALVVVTIVGCAAQVLSPEQRQQQSEALREYTIRLTRIAPSSTRADVQSLVGTPTTRSIFRESNAEIEEWWYPTESGYTMLQFSDDKLVAQKKHRTALRFARDTSIPLSQTEIQVRLLLSSIKVGTSKAAVSSLAAKPTTMLTEQQTAQLISQFRAAVNNMKETPLLMGIDLTGLSRDVQGEMWFYEGTRLSAALFFVDDRVTRIVFSEQPTAAQQNEMMQRAL